MNVLTPIRHLEIRAALAREQVLAAIYTPNTARFDFWWSEWSRTVSELGALRFQTRSWHD